jgi:hypothetical protein
LALRSGRTIGLGIFSVSENEGMHRENDKSANLLLRSFEKFIDKCASRALNQPPESARLAKLRLLGCDPLFSMERGGNS